MFFNPTLSFSFYPFSFIFLFSFTKFDIMWSNHCCGRTSLPHLSNGQTIVLKLDYLYILIVSKAMFVVVTHPKISSYINNYLVYELKGNNFFSTLGINNTSMFNKKKIDKESKYNAAKHLNFFLKQEYQTREDDK